MDSPTFRQRFLRALGPLTLGTWVALVLCWGLQITGALAPTVTTALGRGLLPVVLLLTLATLGRWVWAQLRREPGPDGALADSPSMDGPVLLAVLAVALFFGFAGLAHEVGKGYYTDEGHYLHHARRLNTGEQLFVRTMIYPHLLYHVDAVALWMSDLYPGATAKLATVTYGVGEGPNLDWLVLRWVAAGFGTAAVVPVFLVARRFAGLLGAVLASGLMIFSAHYHDGFHVNICDVPSASLAAFCVLCIDRLSRQETFKGYAGAGVLAGLAAATKYPAGVVAFGIVAVWGIHRWRQRNWHWGLALAGGLAILAFVAASPSLLVYPQATLFGERGIFFGVRQYGQGGWIGVMPTSNTAYYLDQLSFNFGWLVWPLAVLGVLTMGREQRGRWLELLPFPVAYLVLIGSMNMVVVRNLFPAIPALAIVLGGAVAAGLAQVTREWPVGRRRLAGVGIGLLLLAIPGWRTSQQTAAMAQPSTRDAMDTWIRTHVPRGAGILKESYTPNFPSVWFHTVEQRFALRLPKPLLDDPRFDFILLADQAHGRFFRPEHQTVDQKAWYENLFATHTLVHEEAPGAWRRGPRLLLYRLERAPTTDAPLRFTPGDAFLPNPAMARRQGKTVRRIAVERDGQFVLFQGWLAAGQHTLELHGVSGGGRLEVRDLDNQVVAEAPLEPTPEPVPGSATEPTAQSVVSGATATLTWPTAGKAFFYLYPAAGSRLDGVVVAPAFR